MSPIKSAFLKSYALLISPVLARMTRRQPLLFCGEGSTNQLCDYIAGVGSKKILLVTDRILADLGLVAPISSRLQELGITTTTFGEVDPDPTFDHVRAGVEIARENNCDSVLAIGGGSSMDCAKGIAACMTNLKDIGEIVGFNKCKNWPAPLFVIPTTAGTGSEVSPGAVLTDPVKQHKGGFGGSRHMPLAAALDPTLMTTMPPAVTAASGMDALTHAIEAYISRRATQESDRYALLAIKLIFDYLPRAYQNGQDLNARMNMAIASTYAGLACFTPLVGYVHAIAHRLGENYHVPHGLANAVVLPHVLEASSGAAEHRLAEVARSLNLGNSDLGSSVDSDTALARAFIDAVRTLSKQLDIPEKLDVIKSEDIPSLAKSALKECHINYAPPKYFNKQTCEQLIKRIQM